MKVSGIVESSQVSEYSQYNLLFYQGIDISKENTSSVLHHKFIIIDKKIVILGSYNPTKNAQTRNDENLIIIKDKTLAKKLVVSG